MSLGINKSNLAHAQITKPANQNPRHSLQNPPYVNTSGSQTNTLIYNFSVTGSGGVSQNYSCTPELVKALSLEIINNIVQLQSGQSYKLLDNTKIIVDDLGNYTIEDKDAKVIYRACRIRDFNPYINASDMLVRFIGYLNTLKLTRKEAAQLPISLFINWLVLEAAQADGDDPPDDVEPIGSHRLLVSRIKPRCAKCKKFISKKLIEAGIITCSTLCDAGLRQKLLI